MPRSCGKSCRASALGADIPVAELLVLQARAEVLRAKRAAPAPLPGECTTFALGDGRAEAGGVLFGQNVDLVPFSRNSGSSCGRSPATRPPP